MRARERDVIAGLLRVCLDGKCHDGDDFLWDVGRRRVAAVYVGDLGDEFERRGVTVKYFVAERGSGG